MIAVKDRNMLSLSDIKVGMNVFTDQLSEILDTYILLGHSKIVDGRVNGDIIYIGAEMAESIKDLRENNGGIASVYNDSTESGDDVYYEE